MRVGYFAIILEEFGEKTNLHGFYVRKVPKVRMIESSERPEGIVESSVCY